MDSYKSLMIGEKAPAFKAQTTYGMVNFPDDYKGKWLILFSHPADFTPVCTTEMMTFASMKNEFNAVNCELLGLSVDSNTSHIDWCRAMEGYEWKNIKNPNIGFPIIADDMGVVSRMYGMLMPASSTTKTVRTVFFIDPNGTIRAILSYPLTTGRNMKEIMRLLLALQEYDKNGNPTPADWQPGDPTLLSPPQTMTAATERKAGSGKGAFNCLDWYICFTGGKNKPMMSTEAPTVTATAPVVSPAAPAAVSAAETPVTVPGVTVVQPRMTPSMTPTMSKTPSMPMKGQMQQMTQPSQPAQNRRPANGGSIAQQNQLLFGTTVTTEQVTDYMLTRDYPNNGR